MSMRTPRQRAQGLGSAKEGTGHWWAQRVTAVALAPLTILFIVTFTRALGRTWTEVQAIYANPFNALIAALFIGVAFHHLRLGLQVVIEDYVHHQGARIAALIGSTLFCVFFGAMGVLSVAMLAIGG